MESTALALAATDTELSPGLCSSQHTFLPLGKAEAPGSHGQALSRCPWQEPGLWSHPGPFPTTSDIARSCTARVPWAHHPGPSSAPLPPPTEKDHRYGPAWRPHQLLPIPKHPPPSSLLTRLCSPGVAHRR